jgi:hypothetical protein
MSYRYQTGALVAAAVLSVFPASATITINNVDLSRGEYVDYSEFGGRFDSFAGVVLATLDLSQPIDLLSATLYQTAPPGTYSENVAIPLTAGGQQRISWLYMFELSSATTPTLGAGLQLAIWDVMADGGDGPASGILQSISTTPSDVVAAWRNYLALSLNAANTDASYYNIRSRITGSIVGTYVGNVNGGFPASGGDLFPPPPSGNDTGQVPEPSPITILLVTIPLWIGLKLRK